MAGDEQSAQLPLIWLLRDVGCVVISYLATGTKEEGQHCNREPSIHFVILSNGARQSALIRNTNLTYDLEQLNLCVYSCPTERLSALAFV
jgi:hypothetical protein